LFSQNEFERALTVCVFGLITQLITALLAKKEGVSAAALERKFCHLMDHWAYDLIEPVTQLAGVTHCGGSSTGTRSWVF